jgi:putative flavoprotein involved in K+ transport
MDSDSILDVAIIGAGQSGLSTSYLLKKNNLDHIVFEKGQIGNVWRTQRWDSFVLNSPNQFNLLPEDSMDSLHPEGFITGQEYAQRLQHYANSNQLPVREKIEVISLEKKESEPYFTLCVRQNGTVEYWKSNQVVIASGTQTQPKIPNISKSLPKQILQLHSSEYRNPSQLPEGAILIIGSATSGVQIAEDLLEANRKVFLSTSAVARMPRRYRGKDIMDWLGKMQFFDKPVAQAQPYEIEMVAPLMSGVGELGHTISLQSIHKQGATLLGYLDRIEQNELTFKNNLSENVQFADNVSAELKAGIDQFIQATGIPATPPVPDEADLPDASLLNENPVTRINCEEENITSVIWATGFSCDWSWIKLPVLNDKGQPNHVNGSSQVDGLYFMGLPWQRNLKSSLIFGATEDAAVITTQILNRIPSHSLK